MYLNNVREQGKKNLWGLQNGKFRGCNKGKLSNILVPLSSHFLGPGCTEHDLKNIILHRNHVLQGQAWKPRVTGHNSMGFSPLASSPSPTTNGVLKVRGCIFQLATKVPGFKSPCSTTRKTQALQGRGSATHLLFPRWGDPDAVDPDEKPLEVQWCFSGGWGVGGSGIPDIQCKHYFGKKESWRMGRRHFYIS